MEIEQAKNEGHKEGYNEAKKEFLQPTPNPVKDETTNTPEPLTTFPFDFPYSRANNEKEYNPIVKKIQVRLSDLNYNVYNGPHVKTTSKK